LLLLSENNFDDKLKSGQNKSGRGQGVFQPRPRRKLPSSHEQEDISFTPWL